MALAQRPNRYGVRLESWVVGASRRTCRAAVERYIRATTDAANGVPFTTRTTLQRQRAIEAAEREIANDLPDRAKKEHGLA
jgi:hypothetical protein